MNDENMEIFAVSQRLEDHQQQSGRNLATGERKIEDTVWRVRARLENLLEIYAVDTREGTLSVFQTKLS